MTNCVKQYENKKVYVCLEETIRNNNAVLIVSMYRNVGGLYGYPDKQISYPICDKKKALSTYNRYVREAKAEERF